VCQMRGGAWISCPTLWAAGAVFGS
jgi:hypothetical protein